jgi:hypothetical protein
MLKPTGLLSATVVLLILGGTVYYFQKHPKAPDAPATPAAPKILSVSEGDIQAIRIAKSGADPIVLKNLANNWVIAEPKQLPADQDTVKSMVSSLSTLNSDRLIDDHPADLSGFGLTTPSEEIDVTLKNGTVDKILLGSDTPSGSDTYAKLDGKAPVYSLISSTKSAFDKTVTDLRDKRILPFNQDKVTAITLTSKGPPFTFGKNAQGEWQITKPSPMRADTTQVDDLLRKLKDAKMDTTATDQKAIDTQFNGGTALATATVTDNTGPMAVTVKKGKDNSYYARSSAIEGIYKVGSDFGDGLKDKDVDSFRNKKLFEFGFSDPTKIEIDGAAYQKTGDKWTGPKGQIDAGSIQTVIDKLRDLSAAKFADKLSGALNLSLVVTSGDNHKVEKVIVNQAGSDFEAQREGDPTVYVIDAAAFGELRKAVAGIKPFQPPPAAKK